MSSNASLRGPKHFYVYGGPQTGELVRVPAGQTMYSKFNRSAPDRPLYYYVLVDAPDRGKAFVPMNDEELRQALLGASGGPENREIETLTAEIRRRNLRA